MTPSIYDRERPRRDVESDSSVSFVELKDLARKLLSQDSTLRMLIVAEPDVMSRDIGLAKVEVFSRLLHKELGSC